MTDKDRSGRPGKVDERAERRICNIVKKYPFESSSKLTNEYNTGIEEEHKISGSTFKAYAQKNNLTAHRPCHKPFLTPKHIEGRLNFAKKYQNKDMRFWSRVIFCDETSMMLHPMDDRLRVRRPPNERFNKAYMIPVFKHGGGSLMFWGCISWKGQGVLKLVKETLKGGSYSKLLLEVIPESLNKLNMKTAWMLEDKAPPHIPKIVSDTKDGLMLKSLENYPSNSPDLNPLESIWAYWKDKIRTRFPQSLEELEIVAYEEWEKIPLDVIRTYIGSMPNRLNEIIINNGEHIRY